MLPLQTSAQNWTLFTLDSCNRFPMPTSAQIRARIKQIYHSATRTTVEEDLRQAITLLKKLEGESERARVAVYMDGLSQMRSEWILARRQATRKKAENTRKTKRVTRKR